MLLHQKVCETIGITRLDLAEKLGVSKSTIDSWSDPSRMSQTTKLVLELMLENHSKSALILKFNEVFSELKDFDKSNYGAVSEEQDDWRDLIFRMKYILQEYGLNVIEASKRLGEASFDYLDRVLKLKNVPSFDFLDKFSNSFQISNNWLANGKDRPFSLKFIKSNTLKSLDEEFYDFNKIYIVHCSDNKVHTKIIVEDKTGKFDFFRTDFCIGEDFFMENTECRDLFELYEFYMKHKNYIALVSLKRDEYDKLASRNFYAKNILEKGDYSYILYDLFDLDYFHKEIYGDFFVRCTNIIKSLKEIKDKK